MTGAIVCWLAVIAYLPPCSVPTATTDAASGIRSSSATLNGAVNPSGSATTVIFEWGMTPGYGNTTEPQAIGSGTNSADVSAALTGLTPNRTYHYRVLATNEYGSAYGSDATVMTTQFQRVLTVINNPGYGGRIGSADGRIFTAFTGTSNYADGSVVILNAFGSSAYSFTGWSGGACSGTGPCTITMNANQSVTANYTLVTTGGKNKLLVQKTGYGTGTISGAPINCGATCQSSFYGPIDITLTGTGSSGSVCSEWYGCTSVSGN